jgi:hypothetical protein
VEWQTQEEENTAYCCDHNSTLPSMDASRRPRPLRVSQMKISDERGVEDETPRNPAPFLWPITLPIHEVLMPPAPTTNVKQPPDGVTWVVVNQTGRRGRNGRWGERADGDWLQTRDMEGGVDVHGWRQLECDS